MKRCGLLALLVLLSCQLATKAGEIDLDPSDRAILGGYARDTWKSFDALALPSGLPADLISKSGESWTPAYYTSPSDIAAYLWSILAAEDLGIISTEESTLRLGRTLGTLEGMERSHGFFFNWYDPRDGSTLKSLPGGGPVRPFLSTVDNGWLAASLIMIRNARPTFRVAADRLLEPMDFGFFYDAHDPANPDTHPGLLRGGYYTDDGSFATFHYGMLNTEARIASYIAIARGHVPPDHYYRMARYRSPETDSIYASCRGQVRQYLGVSVEEGYRKYRGIKVIPSWDGSMFEALMVSLFIPEAEWAPRSWGVNHPLYIRASIEYALEEERLAAWGASPSSIPGGGYRVYGVPPLSAEGRNADLAGGSVMTPYASFLVLTFAPREAMKNIEILAKRFHAYGSLGFLDSVDVASGEVAESVLSLDQGMIMASIANALTDGTLHRAFCAGKVSEVIQPLIALEQFGSGLDIPEPQPVAPVNSTGMRAESPPEGTGDFLEAANLLSYGSELFATTHEPRRTSPMAVSGAR